MAIYCGCCNRKIRFYESAYSLYPYESLCKECYVIKKEEAEEKRKKEERRKKEAEEKRKAKEEEKIKKEEEAIKRDKQIDKDKEKEAQCINKIIDKLLSNPNLILIYNYCKDYTYSEDCNDEIVWELTKRILKRGQRKKYSCFVDFVNEKWNYRYERTRTFENFEIEPKQLYDYYVKNIPIDTYYSNSCSFQAMIVNKIKKIYNNSSKLLYLLNLCDKIKEFDKNEELTKIYNNLNSTTNDVEYMTNKIYPIYLKFYKSELKKELSKYDIGMIIAMKEEKKLNINVDTSKVKISTRAKLIDYIVKEIGKVTKYNKEQVILFMEKVIKEQRRNIVDKVIFEILSNPDKVINDVNKKVKEIEIEKEKERLLTGNLSKELEMQKLELDFSSIKNGFEFEEYVAKLYKKLGYRIEEITKKSGDQRSRCGCI